MVFYIWVLGVFSWCAGFRPGAFKLAAMKRLMNYNEFCQKVADHLGGVEMIEVSVELTRKYNLEKTIGWRYYQMGAIDAADEMRLAQPDVRAFFNFQENLRAL